MRSQAEVQQTYQTALDTLVEKVQRDRNILAAILFGSFSYDQIWEKSDIDLWLIGEDSHTDLHLYDLVEEGVNIHASLVPRSLFKRNIWPSSFTRSTLLFSKDASIQGWYEQFTRDHIGSRDQAAQLLSVATGLLDPLSKAEKWCLVHRDYHYSFVHLIRVINELAKIEVILNDEVPGREVLQPALDYYPDFFRAVYTDLMRQPKDAHTIPQAIQQVHQYLDGRTSQLFGLILDHLREAQGVRSTTELNTFFAPRIQRARLDRAYEWLTYKGHLQQFGVPLKLTGKSRIELEESAYHYEAGPAANITRAPAEADANLTQQHQQALDRFLEKVQQDRYVIAGILWGDLAAEEVWRRSNLQVILICREGVRLQPYYSLVEEGIHIHTTLYTRSRYKQMLEGQLQDSFTHSVSSRSRLLFTRDETIRDWYANVGGIGERDQETLLLNIGSRLVPMLTKAEKWFTINEDLEYCLFYLTYVVAELARLEAVLHGEIPGPDVLNRAREYNPTLFQALYTDLLHGPKDPEEVQEALDRINA